MLKTTRALAASLAVATLFLASVNTVLAQEFRRLTSAEIREQIVGKTLTGSGRAGNCTFFDRFAADGSATAKCGNYSDTGQWRLGDDALCIKWSKRPNEYCLTFFTDGSKYQVINPNRGPTPFPISVVTGRE
ncbi:MAG TPA: hypothetical protein VF226_04740 [Hyphomicrobiaceae bacterium]|jgi:hypothetical protein